MSEVMNVGVMNVGVMNVGQSLFVICYLFLADVVMLLTENFMLMQISMKRHFVTVIHLKCIDALNDDISH